MPTILKSPTNQVTDIVTAVQNSFHQGLLTSPDAVSDPSCIVDMDQRKLAEAMDELELRNHGHESGTFHTEPISKNISHNVL